MSESVVTYATRRPVAFALAGVFMVIGASLCLDTASLSAAPSTGELVGQARVIDGDTIDIDGHRVRLEGIDAPETGQTCARRLIGTWNCGASATKALKNMVGGHVVSCSARGQDKYGRTLGVCFVDGRDINRRMVEDGFAWAFVKYSSTYVAEEAAARAGRRGVFATENDPPWAFRSARWARAEEKAPTGCAIKGNVTRNGRIYHMPWSPWYNKVVVDEARGERWFCSESEAISAGWRPIHGS